MLAHLLEVLHVELFEFRLGVKGVDVAGAAFHDEENAGFRFRRQMRILRRQGAPGLFARRSLKATLPSEAPRV